MNAKTLASVFRSIPSDVIFPWEAQKKGKPLTRTIIHANDTEDLIHNLLSDDVSDSEEVLRSPDQALSDVFGSATINGEEAHIGEAERKEAAEKARKAFLQQQSDSIAAAKAQAEAALSANKPRQHIAGAKRPRHSLRPVDKSDPDFQLLESAMEDNALMISRWEERRDLLTADEQEDLLLRSSQNAKEVSGTICLFHTAKNYGFIAPDCGGPDIYFTKDSIALPAECQDFFSAIDGISLIAGERVFFSVALNDTHSSRRLKAMNIRVGSEGFPAIVVAGRGRRFSGRVRNYNADVNRGYIQNIEQIAGDVVSGESLTILQKCHCKGVADAVFSLTPSQLESGVLPVNGLEVEYNIMPCLDPRTGRVMAVNCEFKITNTEHVAHDVANDHKPNQMCQVSDTCVQRQETQALHPKLLLLDDGGSW